MSNRVHEKLLISPFFAFYVVHAMQFGVGFLSFQRVLVKAVGQDAWIVVLITALFFHIMIWIMYKVLNTHNTDIVEIHRRLFGRWLGGLLSAFFIIYFLLLACSVLRTFIQVIQVWLFPEIQTWLVGLVLLLLTYYAVTGGFRVIAGICFFSLAHYVLLPYYAFLAGYLHFSNLTPVLDHPILDILKATEHMTFSYLGAEILLICYPFIKNPATSQKWVHLTEALLTLFYVSTVIFSLAFFSQEQLSKETCPVLSIFKFIQLPFIERFEFIGASSQLIRVLPILALSVWGASRVAKNLFSVKQYSVLPYFLLAIWITILLIPDQPSVDAFALFVSKIGWYLMYTYIPVLFILSIFNRKAETPK